MSNHSAFLNDMEFEQRLNELGNNEGELLRFIARQQFSSSKLLSIHDKKIGDLETGDKKASAVMGGISGTITGIIIGVIGYFKGN